MSTKNSFFQNPLKNKSLQRETLQNFLLFLAILTLILIFDVFKHKYYQNGFSFLIFGYLKFILLVFLPYMFIQFIFTGVKKRPFIFYKGLDLFSKDKIPDVIAAVVFFLIIIWLIQLFW